MSACSFLYATSASLTAASFTAMISQARIAALSPRSRPTQATGMPGGIWTIERIASRFRAPLTGTPMTGLTVNDATTPGRAAERPAMATNTSASLPLTSSSTLAGVLWADATAMSKATPSFFRTLIAFSATGMSLLLPRMMETFDIVSAIPSSIKIYCKGGKANGCRRMKDVLVRGFSGSDQLLRTTTRKMPTAMRAPIRIPMRSMIAV